MSYDTAPRMHHISCTLVSGPEGSETFEKADKLAKQLQRYASRLGFGIMHENVDRYEGSDEKISEVLLIERRSM